MAATIGWYGPLIDLTKASSHLGDYVQLLVFVRKSTPVQYKIGRNGGEVVRTDILVGDETRSYFPVTIWEKRMSSQVLSGHVFLLQNLKVSRFGDVVEARAFHCSSVQCLLQPNDVVSSKGLDDLIGKCRLGIAAMDKLQRVVAWLLRARLAHCGSILNYNEHRSQLKVNWKVHEEMSTQDCTSLSAVSDCRISCKVSFHASIGEIFLPITWMDLQEAEAERMFISRRIHVLGEKNLVDDLITAGCQLCGSPVNARHGTGTLENAIPLYCERSTNRLHVVGTIYRPFLLYVWDDLKYLPILVNNKGAEALFGSISAEKVYSSYKNQINHSYRVCDDATCPTIDHATKSHLLSIDHKDPEKKDKSTEDVKPNFYRIWLMLLNVLFKHGKNSPLKFKVSVETSRDCENGRLEMVSISFPAFRQAVSP